MDSRTPPDELETATPVDDAGEPAANVYLNKGQLATALRISVPTLDKLIADGLPYVARGNRGTDWQFDVSAVFAWREDRERQIAQEAEDKAKTIAAAQERLDLQGADNEVPNLSLRQRQEYYAAERMRIALDRDRGFLVETARVRADYADLFAKLADRLQGLPDLLERRCNLPPDAVDDLVKLIDEWQADLARDLMTEDDAPPAELGDHRHVA